MRYNVLFSSNNNHCSGPLKAIGGLFLAAAVLVLTTSTAAAQAIEPGNAYITRFSGTTLTDGVTAIDMAGTTGSIVDIRNPGQPPAGRQWANTPQRNRVNAGQTGQIFGAAIDDQREPNIYVSATSVFGLHRTPDNSGWMAGMWGEGGGPGTVYILRANNEYRPEIFANITLDGRANTGAALGDIAYDRWNRQFFVSDLETGMIHRLKLEDGSDLGRYDHGSQGRLNFTDAVTGASQTLPPVSFNHVTNARITDCAFGSFSQTPACWNFADFRRRVWGLGVRRDNTTGEVRLYYSVWGSQGFGHPVWAGAGNEQRNSLWSVGIGTGGAFDTSSIRREFFLPDFFTQAADIAAKGPSHPVAGIAIARIEGKDIMILAERGGIRNPGLAQNEPFAYSNEARVLRYGLDDGGIWRAEGRYDVGQRVRTDAPLIRANATGGVAFSYGYNDSWTIDLSRPGQFLWITGDALIDGSQVHGAQGTPVSEAGEISPTAPPPSGGAASSYMIEADADGDQTRNDSSKTGNIVVFKPELNIAEVFPGWTPPAGWVEPPDWITEGWMPPDWTAPPDWLPPPWWPPVSPNLSINKSDADCVDAGDGTGDFLCTNTITFTNTGLLPFIGILRHSDTPPAGVVYESHDGNAGDGDPGWACAGANPITCNSGGPVALGPLGVNREVMTIVTRVPAGFALTDFENCADISPAPAGDPPGNNHNCGTAQLPRADLQIEKTNSSCEPVAGDPGWYICTFNFAITNTGHAGYTGPLSFTDTMPAGSTHGVPVAHPDGITTVLWGCGMVGDNPVTCSTGGVNVTLAPGQSEGISIPIRIQIPDGESAENCVALDTAAGDPHEGDPVGEAPGGDPHGNNGDCETVAPPGPDLSILKDGPAACGAGEICSYYITVTNNGPGGFFGVIHVTDIPSGIGAANFVNEASFDVGWTWECAQVGDRIECNTNPEASLNVGESARVQVNFHVPGSVPGISVDNCCWLTEGVPEIDRTGLDILPQSTPLQPIRLAIDASRGTASDAGQIMLQIRADRVFKDRNLKNNRSCVRTPIVKMIRPDRPIRPVRPVPVIPPGDVIIPIRPPACPQCTFRSPQTGRCVCDRQCAGGVLDRRTCSCICPSNRPVKTYPRACVTACKPVQCTPRNIQCYRGRVRGNQCICPPQHQKRQTGKCSWACKPVIKPVTCLNGSVRRGVCYCKRGWQRRNIGSNAYRCVRPAPRIRCSGGTVRGGVCYCPNRWQRRSVGPNKFRCVKPVARISCSGGSVKGGVCYCPSGWQRRSVGPNRFRCVKPVARISCSGGSVKGGVCYCPKGWQRRSVGPNRFRCVRRVIRPIKCKKGMVLRRGRCVRAAPLLRMRRLLQPGPS